MRLLTTIAPAYRWAGFGAAAAISLFCVLGLKAPGPEIPLGRIEGDARLVGYEVLPKLDSQACSWSPAGTLMATPGTLSRTVVRLPASTAVIDEPLRMIRDPFAAFSSVAVDAVREEVAATDENNFRILVYDRMDNTPPQAPMTEPKRVITGPLTDIEFQCGLYIDQTTGDIYAVNNDTKDKLVIFSRSAEGNVPPDRWLETPHGTFGIAVDEENRELFLTVQHDSAVVVYRKDAAGDEPPIRLLQGDRTRLADPHGIAVDTKRDRIFVANYGSTHSVAPRDEVPGLGTHWPVGRKHAVPGSGRFYGPSINVYSRTAEGDAAPLRTIEGRRTQLNWPTGLAYHPGRNELYVTNDMNDSILVFDAEAEGNAAPVRVLRGPDTGIDNPTGVHLDLKNNELWVANFGNHSLTVYEIGAQGNERPRRTIRSAFRDKPSLMIGNPGAIAFDTKRGEILVPN